MAYAAETGGLMPDVDKLIRDQRRLSRAKARDFVIAVSNGDLKALARTAEALYSDEWRLAMLACARRQFSPMAQRAFRDFWIRHGDSIREQSTT
jgi:hypothetical protein